MIINDRIIGGEMKYKDIENYLKNRIESGQLKVGYQIDEEDELSKKFNVSKLTVNKALANLANEGYLLRVKGKGTFVKKRSWGEQAVDRRYHSLSEDIIMQGKVPGAKLIEYKVILGNDAPEIADIFAIEKTDLIHYFVRVRTADDIPVAISYSYISAKEVPYIDVNILDGGSLWRFLADSGFEGTEKSYYRIEAVKATREQALLLKIEEGEPLLLSHHKSGMKNGTIYNYVDTYYITERYKYEYITERAKA